MDLSTKPVDMGAPTCGEIKKEDAYGLFWAGMLAKYAGKPVTKYTKGDIDRDICEFFEAAVFVGRIEKDFSDSIAKYICSCIRIT